MTYTIRPAQRGNAKPLIGIHALSNAGKTYSAMMLARSTVGPTGKIVMIETEEGRGESYADPAEYPEFAQKDANGNTLPHNYDVIPMRGSFSPRNYGEAIDVANKAKPDALIIDSASHEWMGIGGVLDMADKNGQEGKKGLLQWQRPKMDHQTYFMLKFMQSPVPLVILCMRSKYPMVEVWNEKKGRKEPVRSDVLEPVQSEDILSEMFIHGWIDKDHNFHITKYTNRALETVFIEGKPIDAGTGKRLADWMAARRNGTPATPPPATTKKDETPPTTETHKLLLYAADGSLIECAKWGDWLKGFVAHLEACKTPEEAQTLWEHNEDKFMSGTIAVDKNEGAKAQFAAAGKLAAEKRLPPMPDEPPEEQPGDNF